MNILCTGAYFLHMSKFASDRSKVDEHIASTFQAMCRRYYPPEIIDHNNKSINHNNNQNQRLAFELIIIGTIPVTDYCSATVGGHVAENTPYEHIIRKLKSITFDAIDDFWLISRGSTNDIQRQKCRATQHDHFEAHSISIWLGMFRNCKLLDDTKLLVNNDTHRGYM